MIIETTYIKTVFEGMMTYIRAQYDTATIDENHPAPETPYFMYGRKKEILQLLCEKDKDETYKYKKYPLIILYHSQPEQHGKNLVDEYSISPLVSIVTESDKNFRTAARYTNTLEPILYPIMNYLIKEIADNPAFYQAYSEEIEREIRVWDNSPNESGILFNNYLDGIDIQFKNLRLFKTTPVCPASIS